MGLSKSTRIQILLGIDAVFFLLELVVGYAVHSLALVADSFHMLNDVLSLCVGLWAVKVAGQKTNSKMYTYGWQRAETLGALINGVFLVALCLSIFLEAIQRFVEPQEVSYPKLVLIVGCFGLLSNILGLFLFHDHGHDHGHSHEHADELGSAEEGHTHFSYDDSEHATVADETGNIEDVLPQNRIANFATTKPRAVEWDESANGRTSEEAREARTTSPHTPRRNRRKHSQSGSRSRGYSGLEDIYVHPASFRKDIIAASRLDDVHSVSGTDTDPDEAVADEDNGPTEESPLLKKSKSRESGGRKHHRHSSQANGSASLHKDHHHAQPQDAEAKGAHSHGDLNMRGVFLHVMGDALGNIGVIASALFIWLTPFPWRFYTDPGISLIITVIILCSAIPLCKAASRILLQAVPAGISIDDIKDDINELPGIISCHHLHVWQLSDTKLVASLHVQVGFDFKGEGSARYMKLARSIRRCLHEYGIHSSTIQPEFCLDPEHPYPPASDVDSCSDHGSKDGSKGGSKTGSLRHEPDACLLECGDECGAERQCCPVRGDGAGE
ncbi:zinc/cadmium resistance protein-like protein [Rhizodiscina lignyota]|uniref:Zinc/cadmium resistance protein-like protein n=1 Tax=Rhizodiscina lignyota TaxID=1504668 RepID=A0A9P4IHM1_9PEZI|nr:zinc/cadmium resistance protein-like protein [Rhizodiscina lignyota]